MADGPHYVPLQWGGASKGTSLLQRAQASMCEVKVAIWLQMLMDLFKQMGRGEAVK